MYFKFYIFSFFILIFRAELGKSDEIDEIQNALSIFKTEGLIGALQEYDDTSTECGRDLREYGRALYDVELWALMMFDSSPKIPDGILMGNSKFLGQYDECVRIEHPSKNFTGQHCSVNINFNIPMNESQDVNFGFLYGICVPSTCPWLEINAGLKKWLSKVISNTSAVHVDALIMQEGRCNTKDPRPLKDTDWAVVGILIAFGVVALCSTIYDVFERFHRKNEKPHPILSSFSIYSNGKQLFRISEGAGQLHCLNGLRFFSICWVVLCHAYSSSLVGPLVNLKDVPDLMKDIKHTIIISGFVSVDSFFFLSGLLVLFVFFRDISRKKYYDVPVSYIHRYIRLTPPYGMMILIQATIVLYMGTGPIWYNINEPAADACRKNWWSGILYVQNFATPESTCLDQSWYLSTDMQMYWLSPLILYPLLLWPMLGPFYLLFLILAVAFADFAIGYHYELGPNSLITNNPDQKTLDYYNFWTRAVPWLLGAFTAYVICGIQAKKIKIELTPLWVVVGWLASTGLCLGSLYGIAAFTDMNYTPLEAGFYLAFHRVMWGLGLAWITFACIQGYGGIINTFLSWGIFQPLGKLSYCVFLLHGTVMIYRIGASRTNFYGGDIELIYGFLGDLILANLLAIPFTLLFEMPFGNIDRYFLQNVKILPYPRPRKVLETKQSSKEGNDNSGQLEKGVAEDKPAEVQSEKVAAEDKIGEVQSEKL